MPDSDPESADPATSSTRVLVVMRHAKAESRGGTDHARPLAEQGRTDARAAGRWLREQGIVPDRALVSDALRTQQTWEALAEGLGSELEPELDDGVYSAGPDTVLDLVRAAPDDVRTLIVVGHNPTMAYLAQMLDDGEGDPGAMAEMTVGYPTCAMAVFHLPGAWADLAEGTARIEAFHVGAG